MNTVYLLAALVILVALVKLVARVLRSLRSLKQGAAYYTLEQELVGAAIGILAITALMNNLLGLQVSIHPLVWDIEFVFLTGLLIAYLGKYLLTEPQQKGQVTELYGILHAIALGISMYRISLFPGVDRCTSSAMLGALFGVIFVWVMWMSRQRERRYQADCQEFGAGAVIGARLAAIERLKRD